MSKTQRAVLVVQPEYAYGDSGFPPIIPPRAVITYDIELIDVGEADKVE